MYAAQDARDPRGRKRPGNPAGEEVPKERVEAVQRPGTLCHQVNKRLSASRRRTSDAASGSTAASLSLRVAANAMARASSPSFLRALPAKLESTRTLAESLGGPTTTDSPEAVNLPARCRPSPPAFSTAPRRSGNRFA